MVHEHVWRTLCSVCATGARVAWPSLCNSYFVVLDRIVRVGTKISHYGNRANTHRHVAMVHGHVWRTVCSIGATGACFLQPFPWNLKRDFLTCISSFVKTRILVSPFF
jgi:amino acid permease